MTAHLDLFEYLLHLRGLLQLAAHMEERGDRVTMVSAENITLMGNATEQAQVITTSKGAHIAAAQAYSVLQRLKGHEAAEYAVTREELAALNARAVTELEESDALRAFGETLGRITTAPATEKAGTNAAERANTERPSETSSERPRRRQSETAEGSSEGTAA